MTAAPSRFRLRRHGLAALLLAAATRLAAAGELVINTDASDPAPRAAWAAIVDGFQRAHPDVKVKVNTFDHEGFKTSIRNFLTANPPDIVTWYAGQRMAPLVNAGLLEDVSDVWAAAGLHEKMKSTASSLTLQGKQWGLPYTYYPWGLYVRKDVLARHGLTPPKTWAELLKVCAKLKAAGVTPLALGTKAQWPAAGWFDYLNLRVNGLAFHQQLTSGQVAYTDARVQAVFDRWDELVKPGYFLEHHAALDWQDTVPGFVKGESAMMLMGHFALDLLKKGGLSDAQLAWVPFPKINDVPAAEDAPTDTAHIPAKARNKADAKRFLAYLARPEVQARANELLGQLPVHRDAARPAEPSLRQGAELLAGAQGLSQFFDRDTAPEVAKAGMEGFQRYLVKPASREDVLKRLEAARQRSLK